MIFLRAVSLSRVTEPARAHLAAITVRWAWLWAGSTLAWNWHRRRTVPAVRTGCLRPLLRLAAGELLLMGATVGIAVVLSITA